MYLHVFGALMYIVECARPDTAASASILGRKLASSKENDWTPAVQQQEIGKAEDGSSNNADSEHIPQEDPLVIKVEPDDQEDRRSAERS